MLDAPEPLLLIEDLYASFYTQQGVVKAIDGVSLDINVGETFGLVGETGCGKSVTANCVLRLIPSPPGKIEGGSIYFMPPDATERGIADLERQISEAKAKNDAEQVSKLSDQLKELNDLKKLDEEIEKIRSERSSPDRDERLKNARDRRTTALAKYDLLQRSTNFMMRIRGKYISMIFQEPMTALNPVFTAGDQIAEILLLHERADLATAALRLLDRDLEDVGAYHRVSRSSTKKDEYKCEACGALMAEDLEKCPQCGGSFTSDYLRSLRRIKIAYYRRFYRQMVKNPRTLGLRAAARVPILRRYQNPLRKEAMKRAEMMLRLVRIPDPSKVADSYPHELSGGMQQRVMIAMALACKPKLLIADEPTTALDVTVQAQILKLMRDLQIEIGTAVLLITHNLGVVAETCNRVGVMYAGTMAEVGTTNEVFKEPLHPYTQGLMNLLPNIHMERERLEIIEGTVPNLMKPPTGCRFHPRCPYAMGMCKKQKPKMTEVTPGHFTACFLYSEVV